jgi:hypothetical protein
LMYPRKMLRIFRGSGMTLRFARVAFRGLRRGA